MLMVDGGRLERCVVRGCKAGGYGGGVWGGTVVNCLVVGNEAALGGGGVTGADEVTHCTVVRNAGGGVKECSEVVNSIVWGNTGGAQAKESRVSWSLCEGAEGWGCIEGEPGFVDAEGGDWRLAFGSPCINAAGTSETKVDLAGAPRPQPKVYGEEAAADMGCYEYVPKARFVWKEGNAVPPYESWADAARDIQSALDISGDGDWVVVEAGTYEEAVTLSNAVVLTGFRGAEETVIDGGGSRRPVTMKKGGVLEGFTVRNGYADQYGGGIWADGGAVVRNATVVSNVAEYGGGGIYAAGESVVERCVLKGNRAQKNIGSGGGARLDGGSRLLECVVEGNQAESLGGGAYCDDGEIAGCELTGNSAENGGGAVLHAGTFHNNLVSGNTASSAGGGLCIRSGLGHDCLVAGNEAEYGAGVEMDGGELWNITVAANRAHSSVGGVDVDAGTLGNTIVWGNEGGELDALPDATLIHCCWPEASGGGHIASDPQFAGDGDYHLRAGSPCVDAGERRDWMPEAVDWFDGQRRVEPGDGSDGRDVRVDIGADEAAVDAYSGPTADDPAWTWRVVQDARLQLQSTTNLLLPASWTNEGAAFTATNQVWKLTEPFTGTGALFRRLIWLKE